jgi:hypothetical protein
MESEKFCLRWNDFESNISSAFRKLRDDNDFFDVTLSCDNEQIQAHKVILSACSEFFRDILHRNPHQHPLLYLKGVRFSDLQSVLNFMYHGEVNVAQDELNSFLMVAEDLRIKGLTQNSSEPMRKENQSPPKSTSLKKPTPKSFRKDPLPPSNRPRPPSVSTNISQTTVDDDFIQEVVPIKTEQKETPLHHQQHSIDPPPEQFYSPQPPTEALATVDDQMVEYLDETYEDDYTAEHQGYQSGLVDPTKGRKCFNFKSLYCSISVYIDTDEILNSSWYYAINESPVYLLV